MCLSVFARVRAGGRALVGRPAPHARWDEFMPSWKYHDAKGLKAILDGVVFPAVYMREGEDPRRALDRIMRNMLGVRRYRASERPLVYSATTPSGWYPGHRHWDLAFVYDVRAAKPVTRAPWWRELEWRAPGELRAKEFNWNEDLARWLKVAH